MKNCLRRTACIGNDCLRDDGFICGQDYCAIELGYAEPPKPAAQDAEHKTMQKEWLRLTAVLTGNQSGTRCDACRATGAVHCPDAFDGCSGMRPYTVEEIVEVVNRKSSDLERVKLMERCNFKPANQYWREKYEAEKRARKESVTAADTAYAAGYLQATMGLFPSRSAADALVELRKGFTGGKTDGTP